jgi:hypothetical protein
LKKFPLHLLSVNTIYMQKSLRTLFLIVMVVFSVVANAQPGPPPGPPCGGPFGPACPIDGGVSLLIAAGLAYGGKKSYDMARKKA